MIVLDTNVVSELMRPDPATSVETWVDQLPPDDVFITAITAAELLFGVERLPDGRRRRALAGRVRALIDEDFEERVLPFDAAAAPHYAIVCTTRERLGRPISMADSQIAAICRLFGARLATRNTRDFADTGTTVINPWTAARPEDEPDAASPR